MQWWFCYLLFNLLQISLQQKCMLTESVFNQLRQRQQYCSQDNFLLCQFVLVNNLITVLTPPHLQSWIEESQNYCTWENYFFPPPLATRLAISLPFTSASIQNLKSTNLWPPLLNWQTKYSKKWSLFLYSIFWLLH